MLLNSVVRKAEWSFLLGGTLADETDAHDHEGCDDERGERAAQGKASVVERLVEEIAYRGAEGTRQDKCRPEEPNPREVGPEVDARDEGKRRAEQQGGSLVPESRVICRPVAECRAESLRERDGRPIEHLDAGCVDGPDRYRSFTQAP